MVPISVIRKIGVISCKMNCFTQAPSQPEGALSLGNLLRS